MPRGSVYSADLICPLPRVLSAMRDACCFCAQRPEEEVDSWELESEVSVGRLARDVNAGVQLPSQAHLLRADASSQGLPCLGPS